jgi:hypothetical protein
MYRSIWTLERGIKIIYIMLGISLCVVAYIAYLLFTPFKQDTINLHVNSPAYIGEPINYNTTFCGYEAIPFSVVVRLVQATQALQGSSVIVSSYPSVSNIKGCIKTSSQSSNALIIPDNVLPGTYILRMDLVYSVNSLRTVRQTVYTNHFQVTHKK